MRAKHWENNLQPVDTSVEEDSFGRTRMALGVFAIVVLPVWLLLSAALGTVSMEIRYLDNDNPVEQLFYFDPQTGDRVRAERTPLQRLTVAGVQVATGLMLAGLLLLPIAYLLTRWFGREVSLVDQAVLDDALVEGAQVRIHLERPRAESGELLVVSAPRRPAHGMVARWQASTPSRRLTLVSTVVAVTLIAVAASMALWLATEPPPPLAVEVEFEPSDLLALEIGQQEATEASWSPLMRTVLLPLIWLVWVVGLLLVRGVLLGWFSPLPAAAPPKPTPGPLAPPPPASQQAAAPPAPAEEDDDIDDLFS